MRIPIEPRTLASRAGGSLGRPASWLAGLLLLVTGCGEPSVRELKNRRELEALLTAVSLRSKKELAKDAKRIDARHASGELSDDRYKDLDEIVKKAEAGQWAEAEKKAYELREAKPFFN